MQNSSRDGVTSVSGLLAGAARLCDRCTMASAVAADGLPLVYAIPFRIDEEKHFDNFAGVVFGLGFRNASERLSKRAVRAIVRITEDNHASPHYLRV